jgi:hypothetical protein
VGKPDGKSPLGKSRRRRMYNIRMDLVVVESGGMDWIDLSKDWERMRALLSTVVNVENF